MLNQIMLSAKINFDHVTFKMDAKNADESGCHLNDIGLMLVMFYILEKAGNRIYFGIFRWIKVCCLLKCILPTRPWNKGEAI